MAPEERQVYPIIRRDNIISEEILGEYVVYDSRSNKAHQLNATLSWIWRRCDGTNSVYSLICAFETEFHAENAREIVLDGVGQLRSCELLEPEQVEIPAGMGGTQMSRRSLVTAGTAMWPAAVSILAPTAAAARSGPRERPVRAILKRIRQRRRNR